MTVEPALSEAEWRDVLSGRSGSLGMWLRAYADDEDPPEKIMAIANAALPAAHPLKLTRAEVTDAVEMVSKMQDTSRWYGATSDDEKNRLLESHARLMGKLAALFPPEA